MWVPQSHPWPSAVQVQTLLLSCKNPRTYGRKVGSILTPTAPQPRGKNKQTDFLKAVEQRPDHVFAINPELPKEKNKALCYNCQHCSVFSGKEGRKC